MEKIHIVGARTHNLKDVVVDIPRGRLVVITGPSGSGKSSLAFDTVYAEGQRRYAESLSAYARLVMGTVARADVDRVEGLTPTVALSQAQFCSNSRSTVGTLSEVNDFARILFAKAGTATCPTHAEKLRRDTVSDMVACALRLPVQTKAAILAPVALRFSGEIGRAVHEMRRLGFVRLRIDGEIVEIDNLPQDLPQRSARLEIVVDRLRVSDAARSRLAESFEAACRVGEGRSMLLDMENAQEWVFNEHYGCPVCSYTMGELHAAMFSCNTPWGACPDCDGTGLVEDFDVKRLIADTNAPLSHAFTAIAQEALASAPELKTFIKNTGVSLERPWKDLSQEIQAAILHGCNNPPFKGLVALLRNRWSRAKAAKTKDALAALRSRQTCTTCEGKRFRQEVRAVYLGEGDGKLNIADFSELPLNALKQRLEALTLNAKEKAIAEIPLQEIERRLRFLIEAGLGYLTLGRALSSLSGGELQRIRLAAALSSGLTGVTYVLDEPTLGLHPSDTEKLIGLLKRLVACGNSVLVVEHDASLIRAADWVIDMGPGAGAAGGNVVSVGRAEDLARDCASLTGEYLAGRKQVLDRTTFPAVVQAEHFIRIVGARGRNLQNLTCRIPVESLTAVTGVSGSGKSTLILDTLAAAFRERLFHTREEVEPYERLEGLEVFDNIHLLEQRSLKRDSRSTLATYTGVATPIRELFAQTLAARERGYGAGRFALNRPGGRCEACLGEGEIKTDMGFLPSVYVTCSVCQGARFNRETLDVKFKGCSIADVYAMTVNEAQVFFQAQPAIERRLSLMQEIGLGYLHLGERLGALSGGEVQRVRLAEALCKRSTGKTLYVLDEPTAGLHFQDVHFLLRTLRRLVKEGNTVIVIEHNLDVIAASDWVIDLGPAGGPAGGRLMAEGTPRALAQNQTGQTARFLASHLKQLL